MLPTLIPAAVLVAVTIIGVLGLRPFSDRVRIIFDIVCFVAVSAFLLERGVWPIFPPLGVSMDTEGLWLRAIAGAWWFLGARIVVAVIWFTRHRDRHSREARLFSDLSAAAIYLITAAIVLNSVFALPITGIVATSGVVAIVLGLALQNTLADVFAGIAVGIEAPFGIGDRIQIGDMVEGQVVQVNWRSIRIQTDGDDVAIIPNSLVAKAQIVNRSFPSPRRATSVELSCPESAIPERVIETLLHATLLCPDILQTPSPSVVLSRLGPKRNAYKISYAVETTKQLSATNDLLLRCAHRQLYYAGLLDERRGKETACLETTGTAMAARRLLRDLILFACLADRQIDDLAGHLESRLLEPGEVLFEQGATDATLYVVASGILEIARVAGMASPETLGRIGAGEYVGEIGLFTGASHAATATAKTHGQIYQLSREAIAPLLSENPGLAAAFDKSVRRGLAILNRDVAVRATPGVGAHGQLLIQILRFFHFGPP